MAYTRLQLLQQRATPSGISRGRGTQEHADLLRSLERSSPGPRGRIIEPGPDHPLYDDFIRLTDPKPLGRPPIPPAERPKVIPTQEQMNRRLETLRVRSLPSSIVRNKGTQEHRDLLDSLRPAPGAPSVVPDADHPLYDDFIRLTEPKPSGPKPTLPKDPVLRREYERERLRKYRQNVETPEQRQMNVDQTAQRIKTKRRVDQAKKFYGIKDQDAAEMLAEEYPRSYTQFPPPLTTEQYEDQGLTRFWPTEYGRGLPESPVPDAFGRRVTHVLERAAADTWEEPYVAATKAKKPAKPRKPEEVWYDVHKHPEGVPGGMGKSPEHHLRNRGWQGHEIHSATGKTMQYMHPNYPDFTISFGGGSSTKPDHNFRIMYMGDNKNIPKETLAYQPSEAMNKVEQLSKMQPGHVIVPMTHDSAANPNPAASNVAQPSIPGVPKAYKPRNMNDADSYPEFPDKPQGVSDAWNDRHEGPQLKEIPDPPPFGPKPKTSARGGLSGPARSTNDHGTLAGWRRDKAAGEVCPLCRKAKSVYNRDPALYRDLVEDSGGLTEDHLRTTSHLHDRVNAALTPTSPYAGGGRPRHPEGQGPADLGRTEYLRQYREKQRAKDDADVAQLARGYGMALEPEEVRNYPRLRGVVSALKVASQATWEMDHLAAYDYDPQQSLGLKLTEKPGSFGISQEEHHNMVNMMHGLGPFRTNYDGYTHLPSGLSMTKVPYPHGWVVHRSDPQGGQLEQSSVMPIHGAMEEFLGRIAKGPTPVKKRRFFGSDGGWEE